jgi:excisionase family DNA binding protein
MPEATAEAMLKKALRSTDIDNLLLLPAGRTPLDPGALLNSTKFQKIVDLLKTQADMVIIDSGPILKVVETKAMANVVDGVILLVNDSQTRRKVVQQTIDYFRGKPNNNLLGLVFNRVKAVSHGYDYYSKNVSRDKMQRLGRGQQADSATLTLAEVTDYLGVSEETARRWCEEGRLAAVKTGRKWSVRLEDLNEFVGAYQDSRPVAESSAQPMTALAEPDTGSSPNSSDWPESRDGHHSVELEKSHS